MNEGKFKGYTWLYIRTKPSDDGSVPLPSGLPFWTSPDIMIVQPGGLVGGEAVPNQLNHVRVTVWNGGGIQASGVYVEAFLADPATLITPATAKPIGGVFITVQGYDSTTVDLPWTPKASDAGHRCIIARCSLIVPMDTYTNPAIFDVVGDRHVAQRNICVLSIPAGQTMTFRFLMNPLAGERTVPVKLVAVERTRESDFHAMTSLAGLAGGLPATQPLTALGVRMLSSRELRGRPAPETPIELGLLRRADEAIDERQVIGRLNPQLAPRAATVTFKVPGDEEAGRLHVVDVIQVDPETERPQGGLTFVIRVV